MPLRSASTFESMMLNGLPLAQDLEVVRCQRGSAVVAPRVPQSVARASAPEAGKSSLGLQIEAVISGFAGVIRRNPELAGKTEQIGANDLSRPGRVHAKPRIQIEAHPVAAAVAHVIHAERHRLSDLALVAERYLRRSRHLSSGMIVLHRAGVSRQHAGRKHLVEQCAIHGRTVHEHRIGWETSLAWARVRRVGRDGVRWYVIAAFSMATMALYSFPSPFWALPTIFLSGPAAAASIALINATGNLGGFAGPYMIGYLADLTGGYTAGLLYLVACGVIGSALVLSLRVTRPDAEMPQRNDEPQRIAAAPTLSP